MTNEEWRPVPASANYAVSSTGKVRRETTNTSGRAGRLMKLTRTRRGYFNVNLSFDGRQKGFRVHRLVWEAFNGPIPEGLVINHIDGDPGNNHLSNLEAVTTSENILHAFRELGRRRTGEKLTDEQVVRLRERRAAGEGLVKLAEAFDISTATVSHIATGKTWTHVGGPISPSRPMKRRARSCTDAEVAEVKRRYSAGEGATALAKEYGVTKRTVLNWCRKGTR